MPMNFILQLHVVSRMMSSHKNIKKYKIPNTSVVYIYLGMQERQFHHCRLRLIYFLFFCLTAVSGVHFDAGKFNRWNSIHRIIANANSEKHNIISGLNTTRRRGQS